MDQIKSREQIAREGADARRRGLPESKNPYPAESEAHALWLQARLGSEQVSA